MKKIKKIIAFCLLSSALSPNVQAACVPSDVGGVWRTFTVTGSSNFQGFGRGTLVFSATGVLNTASSFLVSAGTLLRFARGRARISATCAATGSLLTNAGITMTLVDGQLDRGKTIISGVYRDARGDVGLVNLVRR